MPTKLKKTNHRHPGGRPPKLDKDQWGQITVVLRHETIERLRAAADSKHFGNVLQDHLDRHPVPSREQYLALVEGKSLWTMGKYKGRKIPVLYARPGLSKEAKRLAREQARLAKLTPEQLRRKEIIMEVVTKAVKEHRASQMKEQHAGDVS